MTTETGNTSPVSTDDLDEPTTSQRGFFVPLPATALATAILALIIVGASVLIWQMWPRTPGTDSAEAGFLRDMHTHHAQAVEMAMIIRDRTEDPELFALATDIALTQQAQLGGMQGMLETWGLPFAGTDIPMTWMGHPTEGLMPGMATDEELEQLRTLPVADAEVLFLQLMIRHHLSGVDMAEAILARSDVSQIETMAERTVLLQQADIDTMNQMLEARGQEPIIDVPDEHTSH